MELSDEETERLSHRIDSDDDRGIRSDEAEEEPSVPKNNDDDDDNDEEAKRRVDPSTSKKKIVKNPQPKLNAERIQGPKGVQTIEKYFEGFKFGGKGQERSDLNRIMKRLEHWAHRLFPKFCYDDFIEKMAILGTKKNVQVFLKKYRLGMITADEDTADGAIEDDVERGEEAIERAPVDEFDKLIAEQIEKQRANEKTNDASTTTAATTTTTTGGNILGSADMTKKSELSDEIRARIEANKKLAMEKKMARMLRLEEEEEEEESKKRKSTESQEDSRLRSRIREVPDNTEKRRDTESERSKRRKLENWEEDLLLAATRSPIRDDNLDEKLQKNALAKNAESSSVNSVANVAYRGEEIFNEVRASSEESLPDLEEATEVSIAVREIEEIPERAPRARKQSMEISADDSEKLLTREELLMAIDGAMEEIIGNKETSKIVL